MKVAKALHKEVAKAINTMKAMGAMEVFEAAEAVEVAEAVAFCLAFCLAYLKLLAFLEFFGFFGNFWLFWKFLTFLENFGFHVVYIGSSVELCSGTKKHMYLNDYVMSVHDRALEFDAR
jgi:hypothetical protein